MDSECWKQVDSLLQSALHRPPQEREVFLRQACGSDAESESEVRSLFRAHQQAGTFLENRAIYAGNFRIRVFFRIIQLSKYGILRRYWDARLRIAAAPIERDRA